ncbi:MAG: hypothetical protein JO332_07730 [Planctomycetaceae bacterium]|nr:hypothetical protein [Planctomycetaceae bacterium]
MKNPKRPAGDPSLFHILLGEPDDDCEICRAHGLNAHDLPEGKPGMVVLDMGSIDEILRCPCPLCRQIDFEPMDGGRGPDPDDPRDN